MRLGRRGMAAAAGSWRLDAFRDAGTAVPRQQATPTTRPRHTAAHRGSSLWRRWGDSNSRGASTPTSLAGRRTRPLCDISIAFPRLHRRTHAQPTGRTPPRANCPTTFRGHLDVRHPGHWADGRPVTVTHGPKSPDPTIRRPSGAHRGHNVPGSMS